MPKRASGFHEPLVVRTCELAPILRDWIEKHDARFAWNAKDNPGSFGDTPSNAFAFSARRYIHERTGITPRALYRILEEETKWTGLSTADDILTAIERRDMLDNELTVVPNPHWTQEYWIEVMQERGCI